MKRRLLSLIRKETLHILRDPRSLFLAIGLPVLLVILFGYAVTLDVRNVSIAVVDGDRTADSRALISRLEATTGFDIRFQSLPTSRIEEWLDRGQAKIVLVIPAGFSRALKRGRDAPVQILADGSDNNTAQIALGYLSGFLDMHSARMVLETAEQMGLSGLVSFPPLETESRVWFNPDLRSSAFIVPGLIAVVMMVLSAMLTSLTMAREWENGTMEQLIASPARPVEITLGKLIPYYSLGLVQAALIITIGPLLFGLPFRGDLLLLFFTTSLFLVCGLGIGLFISTVTRSQQLAFMLAVIFTLLPSFILSGFIFPVSSMPSVIRAVSRLVPARYFLTILRGIFLKGSGIRQLWGEVVPLGLFAAAVIAGCVKRIRLTLE